MRPKFSGLILGLGLVIAMIAIVSVGAQTTTGQKTTDKAKTSSTSTTSTGSPTLDKILKSWMEWFDSHDANKNSQLSLEEQISAFGLNSIPNVLAAFKKTRGDPITRDEFQKWAQEHAPAYAKQLDDMEKKHQDELKKLEDAHAKATGDAKKKLDQELKQLRERHLREQQQHHQYILHHFARR